jgi:propanediol utilization protein
MRDHTRNVFEKSAMKLVSQSISNRHIHVSNEYVETIEGQQTSVFHDGSNMYLTEEQYVMVKHVGLNFISCVRYF